MKHINHGNPLPSLLGVMTHIFRAENLHFTCVLGGSKGNLCKERFSKLVNCSDVVRCTRLNQGIGIFFWGPWCQHV